MHRVSIDRLREMLLDLEDEADELEAPRMDPFTTVEMLRVVVDTARIAADQGFGGGEPVDPRWARLEDAALRMAVAIADRIAPAEASVYPERGPCPTCGGFGEVDGDCPVCNPADPAFEGA